MFTFLFFRTKIVLQVAVPMKIQVDRPNVDVDTNMQPAVTPAKAGHDAAPDMRSGQYIVIITHTSERVIQVPLPVLLLHCRHLEVYLKQKQVHKIWYYLVAHCHKIHLRSSTPMCQCRL